jgi:hypothetical protein
MDTIVLFSQLGKEKNESKQSALRFCAVDDCFHSDFKFTARGVVRSRSSPEGRIEETSLPDRGTDQ